MRWRGRDGRRDESDTDVEGCEGEGGGEEVTVRGCRANREQRKGVCASLRACARVHLGLCTRK